MADSVRAWLEQLGLGRYADDFAANEIELAHLPDLTDADLRELGVAAMGHRKTLLRAVAALSGDPPAPRTGAEPATAPGAPVSPAAERRQLTVLFADLVGSTALSRRLDPEDLRDLMRRYQDAVAGAVTRYGGHVAKYLGDGVLAYFGWPVAYEDMAERGVRAALAAIEAVGAQGHDGDEALAVRIGIATGEVVIGEVASDLHSESDVATGDTPNLAARLQTLAGPSEICIGANTRDLIGRAFELEDRGRREVKGFEQPVAVWRVLREHAAESRFETARRGRMTPLLGREQELGLLLERWRGAQAGEGQVVLLSGEPGIGKSRLVQALQDTVADDDHFRIRYQCSPYHTASALYPVIAFFERGAGIEPADDAETRLDKLEALVRRGGEPDQQALALFASMLSLPYEARHGRLDMAAEQRREALLTALTDELLRLAAQKPVLFLLEDAHWIDPSTLDLTAQCVGRIETAPVLFVCTYRPEQPPALPATSHVTMLQLNRLARGHVEQLVQAVAGSGTSADLIAEIAARTDGVPLFVEEMTRALVEGGLEAGRVGAIPSTLQGSLLARLDRLTPEAREVAQIGAVIGREFRKSLLAMVMDRPVDALATPFETLTASQLLLPGPNRDTVVFKHALIQDAAYRSLLSSRRRDYHNRIAELLADHVPEVAQNQPELIAFHYTEAGEAEPAVDFWHLAGTRARERFALKEAVQYLERGLAQIDAISDRKVSLQAAIGMRQTLGDALGVMGLRSEALPHWIAAYRDAEEIGDTVAMAQAACAHARAHYWVGEVSDQITNMLRNALRRLDDEHEHERCSLLMRLGADALLRGQFADANKFNVEAVAMARRLGDNALLLETLALDGGQIGMSFGLRPAAVDERLALLDEITAIKPEVIDPFEEQQIANLGCYITLEAADREQFEQRMQAHKLIAARYGLPFHLFFVESWRVIKLVLDGDLDAAAPTAERMLGIGQEFDFPNASGMYGIQMFTIQRERGRLTEVAPLVKLILDQQPADAIWRPGFALLACDLGMTDVARETFETLADVGFEVPVDAKTSTVLAYLAEVCAGLGDRERAEPLYQRLDVYRELTVTLGLSTICLGAAARYLGMLADCMDDWSRAEADFEAALALNRKLQAPPWIAHTHADYARMLRRRDRGNDTVQAELLLGEAWQTAERHGMVALQQRIKKLRG